MSPVWREIALGTIHRMCLYAAWAAVGCQVLLEIGALPPLKNFEKGVANTFDPAYDVFMSDTIKRVSLAGCKVTAVYVRTRSGGKGEWVAVSRRASVVRVHPLPTDPYLGTRGDAVRDAARRHPELDFSAIIEEETK